MSKMSEYIDKLIDLEILILATDEDSDFENTYKVNNSYVILHFEYELIYIIEKTENFISCYNLEGLRFQSSDLSGNFINDDPESLKVFKQIEV